MAAAKNSGHIRASDADREQVIEVLKDAFVQGRLTKDELSVRAGLALVARTYAELSAVTADVLVTIPSWMTEARPPKPDRVLARKPVNKRAVALAHARSSCRPRCGPSSSPTAADSSSCS